MKSKSINKKGTEEIDRNRFSKEKENGQQYESEIKSIEGVFAEELRNPIVCLDEHSEALPRNRISKPRTKTLLSILVLLSL